MYGTSNQSLYSSQRQSIHDASSNQLSPNASRSYGLNQRSYSTGILK